MKSLAEFPAHLIRCLFKVIYSAPAALRLTDKTLHAIVIGEGGDTPLFCPGVLGAHRLQTQSGPQH